MYTTIHINTKELSNLTVKVPTKVALYIKLMHNGASTMNIAVMLGWEKNLNNEASLFRILDNCYKNKF